MSITDELRDWFKDRMFMANGWQEIHDIADRIDEEHQKAIRELNNLADASVPLPVDADGVPIRVGDVLDSKVDYLFDGRPFDVRALVLCEDGWDVADGRFGNRYKPNSLRRHHPPTVEDILMEFHERMDELGTTDQCVGTDRADAVDALLRERAELVAEYAQKLRLVEEDV